MKKKIISILLTMIMVLSLMPMTVFASDPESHDHGEGESTITFTPWDKTDSLPSDEGNYYLTNDVALSGRWEVSKDINLCLNGFNIIRTGGNAVTVNDGAALGIYDCSEKEHYFKVEDNGLWTLLAAKETGCKTVAGGCIMGVNPVSTDIDGIGVFVNDGGTFNLYGGNIVGNKATNNGGGVVNNGTFNLYGGSIAGNIAGGNGGGVFNSNGTFNMYGGSITDNIAAGNGGGLYVSFEGVNILTGGEITGNTASVGSGVYYQEEMCLAAGTPITMADGSRKPIETLKIGDFVRVFDHDTGTISTAKLFDAWKYPEKHSGVVTLHFSHDIDLTIVYGHSFFERQANKYVSVSKDNVQSYIGHEFYNADDARWETLIGYDFVDGAVDTYVITSEKHLNCVANGMLNNEDGFYTMISNIFEFEDGLKIDEAKKAADIEKYGLFGFDNMKYGSKETYDTLNLQYLNVAFGKGMITPEECEYMESFWTGVDPELFCDPEEDPEESKPLFRMLLGAAPSNPEVPAPTTPGVYVGGSLNVTGNNSDNLYVPDGKTITIGTGTAAGGNGVVAPAEGFNVGVTMKTPGQFTSNGAENDTDYFTSDDKDYLVLYNADGYLELHKHDVTDTETLFVTNDEGETVDQSPETFEVKEDGIHVYSNNLVFSGETDKKIIIDGDDYIITFKNLVLNNSVEGKDIDGLVLVYLEDSTINGDIKLINDDAEYMVLYLYFSGESSVKEQVYSDDILSFYGEEKNTLNIGSAAAKTYIMSDTCHIENTSEKFISYESTVLAPKDASKPISITVKQMVYFSEDVLNDGKPFVYGEDYVIDPAVYDENGVLIEPKPEIEYDFYKLIDDGDDIESIDGKPTEPGDYVVIVGIPADDPNYYGAFIYDFSIEDKEPVEYKITKGNNAKIEISTLADTLFTSNADFSKFKEVLVDGKIVDPKFYIAKSGSTDVTLKKEYLKTLTVGEHTLTIASTDGEASTKFTILAQEPTPATGDRTNVGLWAAISAVSLAALAACLIAIMKKRKA